MESKINVLKIIKLLYKNYKDPRSELITIESKKAYQFLISVILSARCTDKKVNEVSKILFKKHPTFDSIINASKSDLIKIIKPTGFYKNKTENIIKALKVLDEKHGRKVPNTLEELIKIPGVGRKTANVVLGNYFNIPSGIAVDTHVNRLSQRLGFTKYKNPEKIEKDLMEIIPKKYWVDITNLLIQHGRKICKSQNPKCNECFLKNICLYFKNKNK